jgi:hypothetical protein
MISILLNQIIYLGRVKIMTNKRIRYNKVRNGVLLSRRNFVTGGGREVNVELDLANKKYRILDSASGEQVATGGNTRNTSVLKIQAKRGLTDLGVTFADEVRVRGAEVAAG